MMENPIFSGLWSEALGQGPRDARHAPGRAGEASQREDRPPPSLQDLEKDTLRIKGRNSWQESFYSLERNTIENLSLLFR